MALWVKVRRLVNYAVRDFGDGQLLAVSAEEPNSSVAEAGKSAVALSYGRGAAGN